MTDRELRSAAATLYNFQNNHRPFLAYDSSRSTHSINFITEDFLAGYQQDGRMSVVRRFFCLFVTFDLVFVSLLWIICVMITGDNIYNALRTQVLHYTIYTSLFDIVMAAACRFVILVLFYGLLYTNHWSIISLCTSGSCAFLISKVFYYDWSHTPQPVFEVLLVITSFVLSWGEAWFLDCRVIPQERHARNYFIAATSGPTNERSPLLAPFLSSVAPESICNFYSPIDSLHNSDDEDNEDDEYKKIGVDFVRKAYDLLESKDWKIEKVTTSGDTIQSTHRDKLGKIYRLTARVNCAANILLEDLFYKIEDVPKWNPTLLESKILHKIDRHTDITYQATVGGGGGVVKSRDFVNLRCWQYYKNGVPVDNYILNTETATNLIGNLTPVKEQSEPDDDLLINNNDNLNTNSKIKMKKSVSEAQLLNDGGVKNESSNYPALSKSLGAKDFNNDTEQYLSDDDDVLYADAQDQEQQQQQPQIAQSSNTNLNEKTNDLFISAAISIKYPGAPTNNKYIRGENVISCWAMREINGQPDWCIFEWLLCLDLKGYIPRYVLDTAYTTLMQDYMKFLREYSKEIRNKGKVPKHIKT